MLVLAAAAGFGQTPDYPYVFRQFAGAFPLGDGGPATQALLYNPVATQLDSAGKMPQRRVSSRGQPRQAVYSRP